MNGRTCRRRHFDAGAIAKVRTRRGVSQREFAKVLGIEVDTLRNSGLGRNKTNATTLNLVMVFDRAPELIEDAAFEPVA